MKIKFNLPKTYRSKQKVLDQIALHCQTSAQMQSSKNYAFVPEAKRLRLEQAVTACAAIDETLKKQELISICHKLLKAFGYVYEELFNIISGQKKGSYSQLSNPTQRKISQVLKQNDKLISDAKATKTQLANSVFDLQKIFYAAYLELVEGQKATS
jgi:hypothetical protein